MHQESSYVADDFHAESHTESKGYAVGAIFEAEVQLGCEKDGEDGEEEGIAWNGRLVVQVAPFGNGAILEGTLEDHDDL